MLIIDLAGVWDGIAFEEVAGSQFRRSAEKQIYKGYMEMGSFSRGSGKGTIPAYASFVFNGNIDGDVETRARTSHLFTSFPEAIRYDMAFHGRWHAYVPGWERPKMQPDYFTNHLGFIVDYLAEICRELRKRNYTDVYERHFRLGNHVEERDRKAIVKTVSGLLKLFHPDGQCDKAVLAPPLVPQLVILGDLTIHGVLMCVDSLADKLKMAMDAGAKKVMIPTENKRDFADLPADIIDKL